jgi:hypothetical protein
MAKQRPTLGVSAAPVSTFTAAVAPAVELYDQQTVNLALQFADAFKDLSLSAANLAGTLKKQSNEEELQKGADLVNQSQRTYKQLVDSGEIKPTENPWFAVGAQQASGAMEGVRARAHFMSIYEQKASEDPNFLDSSEGFNALASQYAANVGKTLENSPYVSRGFYESFNPFVASMSLKHEQRVIENRRSKILMGVRAEVAQVIQDAKSPDLVIRNNAVAAFQESLNNFANMGVSNKDINETALSAIVEAMENTDDIDIAESLISKVRFGTGYAKDTDFAKTLLATKRGAIERNRMRMTEAESEAFFKWSETFIPDAAKGNWSRDQITAGATKFLDTLTLSPQERESKRAYVLSQIEGRKRDIEVADQKALNDSLATTLGKLTNEIPVEYSAMSLEQYSSFAKSRILETLDKAGVTGALRQSWIERFDTDLRELVSRETNKREAESRNAVFGTINSLTSGSDSVMNGMTEEQYRTYASAELEMVIKDRPEDEKYQFRELFNREFEEKQKERMFARQVAEFGAVEQENMRDYFGTLDAALKKGDLPKAERMRSRVENYLISNGVQLDSAEAKKILQKQYADIVGRLNTMEGDTRDNPADAPEVKKAKAERRAQFMALRMDLGRTYGDYTESSKLTREFIRAINPANVESPEGDLTGAEDMIRAVRIAINNNIPLSDILPSGTAGKAMEEEMQFLISQIDRGTTPRNALADLAQRKVLGTTTKVNFIDAENPMSWADLGSGRSTDSAELGQRFSAQVSDFEITVSDSAQYAASKYRMAYINGLQDTKSHRQALNLADKTMEEQFVSLRGSLIPTYGLPADTTPAYLDEWLKRTFPKTPSATFVVLYEDQGQPVFVLRDADGNMVPGSKGLYRKEEMPRPGEEDVIRFGIKMKEANRVKGLRPHLLNF